MTDPIVYRKPNKDDGSNVWAFIREAGGLDANTAYCYIMLCDYFRDTCVLAERDGEILGFVSAFFVPDRQDTLFVWQIAVASSARGQGVGKALLQELLERRFPKGRVRHVETTISPPNTASRALFAGFANRVGADMMLQQGYSKELFPIHSGHDEEMLFRIGPIPYRGE